MAGKSKPSGTKGQNPQKSPAAPTGAQRSASMNWILVVVAIALVATIAYAVERRGAAPAAATAAAEQRLPVPDAVMANLTSIPDQVWESAGTLGATVPVFVAPGDTTAKPLVLYMGSLFCPYCAAARWSVVAALSRFGQFSGLTYSASSSVDVFPSTPTFSFYGSRYTSQYLELQAVELEGAEPVAGRYPTLETPTPAQEAVIRKYDAPPFVSQQAAGSIPFMLIGGRFMWSGSPFNPGLLSGLTQEKIAAMLPAGTGNTAQAILANANEITAAICAVDGQQPSAVCKGAAVQQAIKALPTKAP